MITRLFRSRQRLDSSDPSSRRAAIEALTEDEARQNQTSLITLATTDPDRTVRISAIARLADEKTLNDLLDDPEAASHALTRILDLLDKGGCPGLADEPRVLAARLETAEDPESLGNRLLDLGSGALLIDALLNSDREARTRLLTLSCFQRLDLLQELEKRSRDRDKASNRFARKQLDVIRQRSAEADRLISAVEARLAALEKPATDTSETERIRRAVMRERVESDLSRLDTLTSQLAAASAPLPPLEPLRMRLQEIEPETEPDRVAAASTSTATHTRGATAASAVSGNFDDLAERFEQLDSRLATSTDFDALASERQNLTDQWLTRADTTPPAEAAHATFERVSHRFQELAQARERLEKAEFPGIDLHAIPDSLDSDTPADAGKAAAKAARHLKDLARCLDHVAWPDWAAMPDSLTEQQTLLAATRERIATWQGLVDDALRDLANRLDALDEQIESGELKQARSAAGEIRRMLPVLPERSTTDLTHRLARASARLNELGDWQTFATTPKREALLAAMCEIADTPLDAPEQAQRIRSLRRDWNELGSVGRAGDHKLVDAFNEAAERAFEPCRAHFEAQAAIRADNLAARENICDSLGAYLTATDWTNADFKAAERILRTAREEWRDRHPVDRSAGKSVEARFESLQAELHQHIKSEWDRNLAAKRQIVGEAQALADSDLPVVEKVETAKKLQHQWKAVGITPRRPDQTLWREFRAACDAVFETRDTARAQADAEIQAARERFEQVLAGFRQQLDDGAAVLDAGTVRAFQQLFNELPPLPQRLSRTFERERDELLRTAQHMLSTQRAARELERLQGLKAQDATVSALEQRQLAGETIEFTPPDPLFDGRCQPGVTPTPADALIRIVIEAEIAAGLESAETDLRMSIQVALMNAGRGREALDASPETLTRRWCELGPKDVTADPLRERFFQAIGRLLER